MLTYFEIAGTRIRYEDIKDFRVVQREYIFRPVYAEADRTALGKIFSKNKYMFTQMEPYAAIVDERSHKSALEDCQPKNLKESMGKELFEGAITTIGDKLNIKAFRAKKYHCINQAGRQFDVYLEDIPAVLVRLDGKVSDVQKNDELYPLLGEPIAPTINMIEALAIKTKDVYLFYGAGIHIADARQAFQQLSYELEEYETQKKERRKIAIPHFALPGKKKKAVSQKELGEKVAAELPTANPSAKEIQLQETEYKVVVENEE